MNGISDRSYIKRTLNYLALIITAAVLITGVLMPARDAYADDPQTPSLSGTMNVRIDDFVYGVYTSGTSTAEAPCRLMSHVDQIAVYGYDTVIVRIQGYYSGLAKESTYNGKLVIYDPRGSFPKEIDVGSVTTSETGEGTFDVTGNFKFTAGMTGRYSAELHLEKEGGDASDTVKLGEDHSDNRYSFIIGGFDGIWGSEVTITKNQSVFNPHINFVTGEDAKEGITVSHRFKMVGLRPNTEYGYQDTLYDYNEQNVRQGTVDTKSGTFTTDENGEAEVNYTFGTYDSFQVGHYYPLVTRVHRSGSAIWNRWNYEYTSLFGNIVIVVIEGNEVPEEEETFVDLTVKKVDQDTQKILPGAKLRIVDKASGETVKEWTSGDEIERVSLPLGEYTLIEDSAPGGYEKTGETDFELTGDKALIRGYAFAAYTDYMTIKNNYSFYEMYYHRYGDTTTAELGYCINTGMTDPQPLDHENLRHLFYKEHLVESTELLDSVTNKTLTAEELNDHIKRVIYNGYPTNASGIKEKYDLDDEEFRFITQMAVHHYTDAADWDDIDLGRERNYIDAYRELCACEVSAPDDMILRVYIVANPHFQSLVSAEFKRGLGLDLVLANKKVSEEEEKKDEEKKEEEKKEEEKVVPKPDTPEDISGDTEKAAVTLKVSKSTAVKKVKAGGKIPYRITVENTGTKDAKNVNIRDIMSKELKYISDTLDGSNSGHEIKWVRDIKAGEKLVIDVECRVVETAMQDPVNRVEVEYEELSGGKVEAADKALVKLEEEDEEARDNGSEDKEEASADGSSSGRSRGIIKDIKTGDGGADALMIWIAAAAMAMALMAAAAYRKH